MSEITIGLAGVGYWGTKLARNIDEASGCRLAAICDPEATRLLASGERYRDATQFERLEDMLSVDELDAVVLASPASLHADHIRMALDANKHVLVEKPLALSLADCDDLVARADATALTLMVGHTFVYSEPVRVLRGLIRAGELGRILYTYAHRLNLGVIREDLNALWNFGPHDVSILLYLLERMPERVSANEYSLLNRELQDVVFLVLEFPDEIVAHVHESWLDPRKIRQLTVVGDRKMVVYDDTDVETPLRIYDKGITVPSGAPLPYRESGFGEFKLETRTGDMVAPRVLSREPLHVEIEHFVECVATGAQPETDARHGRDVVAILEAADHSARTRQPVELSWMDQTVSG
ncbi:MAG: Gfo/Idh/MocA family oxidoreductase [Gaiellaceae bacterium]